MSNKNSFIFDDFYPDDDITDYSNVDAYEMGVVAGWKYVQEELKKRVHYIPTVECRMNEPYVRLADVIKMLEMNQEESTHAK